MDATTRKLAEQLCALGVGPDATVMVHASLRRIGAPADVVIAALDRALAPGGTWLMVLGDADPFAWVNARPVAEREALLADAPPFDCLKAPADPEVGWLAERMRQTPGTRVTDHPEGRFAARGARAVDLLADPPWHDYFGPGSPLARLCQWGGHVLRLGAHDDTTTLLHYAEYVAELPDKRRSVRHRKVRDGDGRAVVRTVACLDDCDGIVDWHGEDYFALILRAFRETGVVRCGPVGAVAAEWIDARRLVAFGAAWMERELQVGIAGDNVLRQP